MRDRLVRCAALACVMLPPMTLWLGFADNIETPKRIVLAGLALVLALATAASAAARDRLARAPLTGPGLGLAALYLLSARLCGVPVIGWAGEEGSWMGASTVAPLLLAAVLAGAWMTPAFARRLAAGLAVAATLSVGYEVVQAGGIDPMPWNPGTRGAYWLFAALGNPVYLANLLVAAFWASFLPWPRGGGAVWLLRAIWLAGAAATGERSAVLGFAAGGVVAVVGRRPAFGGRHVVLAAVAVLAAWGATRETRLVSGLRLFGARPAIWEGACRLVRERPVLGIGPDLFYTRFPRVVSYAFFVAEPPDAAADDIRIRLPGSTHNELLGVAAAVGLAGLGLYLWALAIAWTRGRNSPLLPAAAALWSVHQVNPPCVTTLSLLWFLLAGASARPGRVSGRRPVRRGPVLIAAIVVVLLAGLGSALRGGLAQAHRREAGRLAFFGQQAGLRTHLLQWDGAAASIHPRQAAEDAALWRASGEIDRARALLDRARTANPDNIFYASALADLELNRGGAGTVEAEAILRSELVAAPGVLSLHDDLAGVLERRGRKAEAAALRDERRRLDPLVLFATGKDRRRAAGGVAPPAR